MIQAMSRRLRRRSANGLPEFLAKFASDFTPDHLIGSILLLRLQREIDDLMSFALGLSKKYHHGHPSPWSHCVLITGPYQKDTPIPILDCTIRDKNDKVDWTMPIEDFLSEPLNKQGRIYEGCVDDYVDKRVTLFGIKFMPDLTNNDRTDIVAEAGVLKNKGYHYDIPGLFRELARFLFDIEMPPPGDLLHCSGFCQKAYVEALGRKRGMFDLSVVYPEDATDDEIWYPDPGQRYPKNVPLPATGRRIALASPSVRKKHGRRRRAV